MGWEWGDCSSPSTNTTPASNWDRDRKHLAPPQSHPPQLPLPSPSRLWVLLNSSGCARVPWPHPAPGSPRGRSGTPPSMLPGGSNVFPLVCVSSCLLYLCPSPTLLSTQSFANLRNWDFSISTPINLRGKLKLSLRWCSASWAEDFCALCAGRGASPRRAEGAAARGVRVARCPPRGPTSPRQEAWCGSSCCLLHPPLSPSAHLGSFQPRISDPEIDILNSHSWRAAKPSIHRLGHTCSWYYIAKTPRWGWKRSGESGGGWRLLFKPAEGCHLETWSVYIL